MVSGDFAARIYGGVLTQDQINALDDILVPAGAPEPASLAALAIISVTPSLRHSPGRPFCRVFADMTVIWTCN